MTLARWVSGREIGEVIDSFQPLTCWHVGLYCGSMLYFEMGDIYIWKFRNGYDRACGLATLNLNSDDWQIRRGRELLACARTIDRSTAEGPLADAFCGKRLRSLTLRQDGGADIGFDGDLSVSVDPFEDGEEADDAYDLLAFFVPDGRIFAVDRQHGLFLDDCVSEERREAWQRQGGGKSACGAWT